MTNKLKIEYLPINQLKPAEYNPRKISEKDFNDLAKSLSKFGTVDPLIINSSKDRYGIVVGGNQRLLVLKKLGHTEVPVVKVNISDIKLEQELNIRLNRNQGEFEWKLLADFNEEFLSEIGFTSEELDDIFDIENNHEVFDLEKELKKLDITKIEIQKGDIWQLGEHRLMCGDSTVEADIVKLMNGQKADLCLCDPPYQLDYLKGKRHGRK